MQFTMILYEKQLLFYLNNILLVSKIIKIKLPIGGYKKIL